MRVNRKSLNRLTAAELKLVLAIKANPELSRSELAERVGATLSSVNHRMYVILDKYCVASHAQLVKKLQSRPDPSIETEII